MSTKSCGFWITMELYLDKNLTMAEKFLFTEIKSLSSLDKGCIATNQHFADLLQIKRESVSRSITRLKEKGYIDVAISDRNHKRVITINKLLTPINKMLLSDNNLLTEPLTNCLESKENNSVLNNSLNNNPKPLKGASLHDSIVSQIQWPLDFDQEMKDLFLDFMAERRDKKKYVTARALKALFKKLHGFTREEQIESINNSITAGWPSLYPKKGYNQPQQQQSVDTFALAEQMRRELAEAEHREYTPSQNQGELGI